MEDSCCSCGWKKRYEKLLLQYNSLTGISRLCTELGAIVDDEYERFRFMIKSNLEIDIPYYMKTLVIVVNKIAPLARMFDQYQPHVRRYRKKLTWLNELIDEANREQIRNLQKIVAYKCLYDKRMIKQFKQLVVAAWGEKQVSNIPEISPWDTDLLQKILGVTDKRFRIFKVEFNHITRGVTFASERQVGYLRDLIRALTGVPFIKILARSKGRGKIRSINEMRKEDEMKNFLCFFMSDLEALALCVDSDINKNEFLIPPIMGDQRTIFGQLAGDKQTTYGYGESIASFTNACKPMSANRSIPTILIIGDFADERSSHLSVLRTMENDHGYNKAHVCAGLTDWPVIISTVLYSCDKDSCIESRYSFSSVAIWEANVDKNFGVSCENYQEKKHTQIDEDVIKIKNDFVKFGQEKKQKKKKKKSKNNNTWEDAYGKSTYICFSKKNYIFVYIFVFIFFLNIIEI